MTIRHRRFLILLLVAASVLVAACGDDEAPLVPAVGTIEITLEPGGLDAGWTVVGPGGYLELGQGPSVLEDLQPGDYTVLWSELTGWIAPASAWGSLESGGSMRFTGAYVQQGSVVIECLPGYLLAPWTLSGPGGFSATGEGADTLVHLDPGEYTLVWGDVSGWTTPDAQVAMLESGRSLVLSGSYQLAAAETPDQAMQLFRETYGGRVYDRYRLLLSHAFLFVDQEGGLDDYAQELVIADRMFNQEEGDQNIVIADIDIGLLEPLGVWSETPADDPHFGGFAGSQQRPYQVDIRFFIAGQNLIYRVQGPVIFHVRDEGIGEADIRLLGIVDATYGAKATENHSWSAVRALFD